MKHYSHILAAVAQMPWAIREEKLSAILEFLMFKQAGGEISAEEIAFIAHAPALPYLLACDEHTELSFHAEENPHDEGDGESSELATIQALAPANASRSKAGAIAVLPIHGTIMQRANMFNDASGGTSTERLGGWLRSAIADPNVKAIVMDVDSPGGGVPGVQELGDEIMRAREAKPIIAVANAQAASAAYWLASQANEIVVTPSGEVGSIGVFAAHHDVSKAAENEGVKVTFVQAGKYKTEANPFEPLSEEAKAALQDKVNVYYDAFVGAVARGRSVSRSMVEQNYGQGRMLTAKAAVQAGMADRVASLDQTLRRLGATARVSQPLPERTLQPAALALRQRELELSLYT